MTWYRGVLIEGVDYIGKTSVAERLCAQLAAREAGPVSYRKCYMSDLDLVGFLDQAAKRTDDLEARDWHYTCALSLDLQFLPAGDELRVQERHWLTQIGRNRFFHRGKMAQSENYIQHNRTRFSLNVLLTSDRPAKQRRAQSRPPNSPRDLLLSSDPGLHQAYEDFLRTLVPRDENWVILDTTDARPDELAARIVEHLEAASAL